MGIERRKEAELHEQALDERRRRKQAHLQRIGEDMKRRAILADRKQIEAKVNEAMEMARRSKIKRQRIYWFRRMENLSKMIISADNFDEVWRGVSPGQGGSASIEASSNSQSSPGAASSTSSAASASSALLSRNVSVPFLLRQLGGAKGFPQQKSRRIPMVDNVQRDILESSYDILPEDAPRFQSPDGDDLGGRSMTPARERAKQLYGVFSEEEKMKLLEQKIEMLRKKIQLNEDKGQPDNITMRLLDELEAAKLAAREGPTVAQMKARARGARGMDVATPGRLADSRDDSTTGRS